MLLVLNGARTHRDVGEKVNEVLVVGGIEHLVRGEHARLLHHAQMHVADGLHAAEHVVGSLGVGVVEQALVAHALGARLVGVDARDHDETVLDLLGELGQTAGVVEHGILAVGRARADDEEHAVVLAAQHRGHGGVKVCLARRHLGREWHLGADVLGDGQETLELHGHEGFLRLLAGVPPHYPTAREHLGRARAKMIVD